MEQRFTGKVAIVTGASRGIGRAIARRLGAEGSKVVLCARHEAALDEAAGPMADAAAIAVDLRRPNAAARVVEFAMLRFGRIDLVVNNAGATKRGEFLDLADEDFTDGFALKYFGAVRMTRAAWPHLKASGGGVIFISGIGGWTPGPQFAVGGSVNAALYSLTKAVAELGIRDGVQVNLISPGTIRTDRFTIRLAEFAKAHGLDAEAAERAYVKDAGAARIGEPEDIAGLVAFVASAEGRFFHGSLLDMDGGATKGI